MAATGALCVAAAWVGLVSLVAGLLLVRSQTARGPPHPFTSAFVSGLLIGISVLVVLPEALDRLPAAGFTNAQVLLLFLGSAAVMFFLDHSVMEHQHVGRGERLPTSSSWGVAMRGERLPTSSLAEPQRMKGGDTLAVPTAGEDATAEPSEETDSDTEEASDTPNEQVMTRDAANSSDELAPLPHAPVAWCPCHGGDPFANGGVISFNPMRSAFSMVGGRQVCPNVRMVPTVPSPPPSPPSPPSPLWQPTPDELEEGCSRTRTRTSAEMQLLKDELGAPAARCGQARCQRVCAVAIRVCAWMLHAMIDGMVLSSAPSTYVLIATAVPVTACALQDVAAFTVTMARLGASSRRSLTAAVVALSCAFPFGALISHIVLESASSDTAVNVVRAVVAGVFTYMALFELAPPHTHSRAANCCYLLCFTCGAAVAYLANVVEQLTADEANASAVVDALKQLAPNGTLGCSSC